MNKHAVEVLEYNKIIEHLKGFAISEPGKEMIEKLEPYVDINLIDRYMAETTEARAVVNTSSSISIHTLYGVKNIKEKLDKEYVLSPEDLELISSFLNEGRKLKRFMKTKESIAPGISNYAGSISELNEVIEEIDRCILRGRVDDKASSNLSKIRKKISILETRIKSKLDGYLKNSDFKGYIQDSLVSQRDGRYVIPVKSEYKRNIEGKVLDTSGSGSTVFIEPAEVKKFQDELNSMRFEEEKEVYKILSGLTALVVEHEREISINIETMVYYDFIFAKGKYSKSIDGRSVALNTRNYISIKNGRHPLLGNNAVPLDCVIGEDYRSLIITGPNTGGKTVVLKTVGLLTMMAQSGLHVPVEQGSEIAIFLDILADIGDGQSIEQNLSTFSSHIKNIISILNCADKYTLVLLDEIGSGTDPGEGMGIGIAVLEEVYSKGATTIATTHYSEIKEHSQNREGFINGSMEFDLYTLKPVYKLNIGKAGESNAFLIALRLGMDSSLIEKAHSITYKESKDYSSYSFEEEKIVDKNVIEFHEEQIEKFKKVKEKDAISEKQKEKPRFNIGDCVYISTMNRTGVVCGLENNRGEVEVMVMKKKLKINHKRLSLYIDSKELYPEEYDFDIIFDTKENRKNKHLMDRKHVEGVQVKIREGNEIE